MNYSEKCPHRLFFSDLGQLNKLQSSCKSNSIECRYYFVVSTSFDGVLCCSGFPCLNIPIIKYNQEFNMNLEQYRPDNWNPQIMPQADINNGTIMMQNSVNPVINGNIN